MLTSDNKGGMGLLTTGLVVLHEWMGDPGQKLRRLVLKSPAASQAQPGQFVHIQVREYKGYDPLLRRPISIADFDREKGEITLLYRVVGKGTELLAQAVPGERLSLIGPVGNGFSLPESGELWLVTGGIGIFPLYPLALAALEKNLPVHLFWGGQDKAFLESAGLKEWEQLGIPINLSTLDGSLGIKGLVTQLLCDQDEERKKASTAASASVPASTLLPPVQVAACGPYAMMKAVAAECLARHIPLQVSLEERMGCAVGACLGCICTVRNDQGQLERKKVCQDGPVFWGEQVVWDGAC